MGFDNWDEIRTAFQVARVGTVSGAAEVLGVHHATVIRHIDALEGRLRVKLFQRHPRGYTPTEAGQYLLAAGQTAEDQFAQLAARIEGAGEAVTGELILTSLPTLSGLVIPALAQLQVDHPGLTLRYLTDSRVFRLEYGEAHLAIRAGARPTEPDYVAQPFAAHRMALYASVTYAAARGLPVTEADLAGHRFVVSEHIDSRAPFLRWLHQRISPNDISFRANEAEAQAAAVAAGMGLGFLPVSRGARARRSGRSDGAARRMGFAALAGDACRSAPHAKGASSLGGTEAGRQLLPQDLTGIDGRLRSVQ